MSVKKYLWETIQNQESFVWPCGLKYIFNLPHLFRVLIEQKTEREHTGAQNCSFYVLEETEDKKERTEAENKD